MHDNSAADFLDGEGNVVYKHSVRKRILNKMVQDPHAVMKDYDYMFLPYSQIRYAGNKQQQIIAELARDNIIILDESHLAGGESATGEFIKTILQGAENVVYLSATYAKTPKTMPLYFRTSLGTAGIDIDSLIAVMQEGGVPLQQMVAIQLAKSGELIRREMNFEGVNFNEFVDFTNEKRDTERADKSTEILRTIVEFDRKKQALFDVLDDIMKKLGSAVAGKSKTAAGIESANFTSVVHNFISQMLLALKVDNAADSAIKALKEGKKPVLNLMNTMESFIKHTAEREEIDEGDTIAADFNDVLKKALDGTLKYTVTDEKGDKTYHTTNIEELGNKIEEMIDDAMSGGAGSNTVNRLAEQARRAYESIKTAYYSVSDTIDKADLGLTGSPIDYIKNKIQQAGYSIGEITGREYYIDYSGDAPTLQRRTQKERNDRNTPVNDFNSDKTQALIFNSAGSVGLSLHASVNFKSRRVRSMVILQPDLNIDTFMQALGRIFRKGQVVNPEYSMILTALPAEIRPAGVLRKKLKSLNANVSGDAESSMSLRNVSDMMNMYGDKVTREYLEERHDILSLLGFAAIPEEDTITKVTGRVALLPVAKQKEFYEDIEERYKDLLEHLNQIGENRLIAKDYDFKAETIEKTLIDKGTDENNTFSSSTYLEKTRVNILKKPFNAANIKEKVDARLKGKSADEINGEIRQKVANHVSSYIESLSERYKDPDVIEAMKTYVLEGQGEYSQQLNTFRIGHTYDVEITEGYSTRGVLVDVRYKESDKGNPVAGSRLRFTFAVADPIQTATLSLMQSKQLYNTDLIEKGIEKDWDSLLSGERKEDRYIITGNLLNGFARLKELPGARGEVITYTDKEGSQKQGILIPKSAHKDVVNSFKNLSVGAEDVMKWLPTIRRAADFDTTNGEINFSYNAYDKVLDVSVRRGKQTGGKYYLDNEILALVKDGRFTSFGSKMSADVESNKINEFLTLLQTKFNHKFLIPRTQAEGEGGVSLQIEEGKDSHLLAKPDIETTNIKGNIFGGNLREKRKVALRYAMQNLRGIYKNTDTGWDIKISRQGILKALSKREEQSHFDAITALPDLLKKAVLAESHPDKYGTPDIKQVHRFYAPLVIDKKLYRAKLTVKETMDGRRFYDHSLTEIEKPASLFRDRIPEEQWDTLKPADFTLL